MTVSEAMITLAESKETTPEAAEGDGPAGSEPGALLHTSVYNELRRRFITGQIFPGRSFSTRGLAQELGVSQTPVREALSRLAAEGAIQIRSKRKVEIPPMTPDRFDDLLRCRLLLEPESAALALPYMTSPRLRRLRELDSAINDALDSGDVDAYMQANANFHFTLYRTHPHGTLNQLIEVLWLQFGPYMRVVYGRVGTAKLVDQHAMALDALVRGDEATLRQAIRGDIADGMGLIGRSALDAT
ncbi:GntR family transcriptional regulator [Phenylobacterium sp. LjRoot225]|uniref:GntR family transcriptional regulator n=1 Tax=Phenylobacterium sp. LjRoot225 TaxID=3342285 RepID=UPI003ED16502